MEPSNGFLGSGVAPSLLSFDFVMRGLNILLLISGGGFEEISCLNYLILRTVSFYIISSRAGKDEPVGVAIP